MKKITSILTFAMIATLIFSCKKETIAPPDITGNWIWLSTFTGGASSPENPLTPINAGYTQFLAFSNNNWTLARNNLTVSNGTYSIAFAKSIDGRTINAIHFYRSNAPIGSVTYYSISNDILTFSYDISGSLGSGATNYKRK